MSIKDSNQAPLPFTQEDTEEQSLVSDMRESFQQLGKEVITSKVQQQTVLAQSVQEGGPASIQEALLHLMTELKIGMRAMSIATGTKRKRLLNMLHGRETMPPEVFDKVYEVIRKRKPSLFDFNKKPPSSEKGPL